MVAASTQSSHHSAHRPTSIVRGIPAEEKTTTYTTTEHHTAPVTYTTTVPTELPSYYAATQPIEVNPQHLANPGAVHSSSTTSEVASKQIASHTIMQQHMPTSQTTTVTTNVMNTPVGTHEQHSNTQLHTAVPSMAAQLPRSSSTPYGESYTQETRKISSVVVESTLLGDLPAQDGVRYIDVPTVEEQVKIVTRKEVREIEKIVHRPEIEWVERVVVVPRVEYVDKVVEVERVHFTEKHVKVPQVKEVSKDVIVEKKVVVPRVVEQRREVPGPVVERPVAYTVEKYVEVLNPVNREVPVIVAQTIKPVITESSNQLVVDAFQYEPEIVPVDVHLARPVTTSLEVVGKVDERHKLVTVTAAQYNSILRALNVGVDEKVYNTLPFIQEHGSVPFCAEHEANFIVAPDHVRIEGWTPAVTHRGVASHADAHEMEVMKSMHSTAVPAGGRCCGPSEKRTTQPTAAATHATTHTTHTTHTAHTGATHSGTGVVETTYVQRAVSIPNTEQRTVVTEDKTLTYDEQRTLETGAQHRSEMRVAGPEGGSIRSQVQVVPSQHGTVPAQRSRVCC